MKGDVKPTKAEKRLKKVIAEVDAAERRWWRLKDEDRESAPEHIRRFFKDAKPPSNGTKARPKKDAKTPGKSRTGTA